MSSVAPVHLLGAAVRAWREGSMQSRIILGGTVALILSVGAIVPLLAGTRFPEVTVDQAQELIHKHIAP